MLHPSLRGLSPEIDALATAHGLSLVGLAEHFERVRVKEDPVPYLATPKAASPGTKKPRPLFRMQSGWTWEMLTTEVATAGRLIFCCDGQREDVRLPKSRDTNHSESYEILFNLAFANPQEFHTLATWEKGCDTLLRRFNRLRKQLGELFPAPDGPFHKKQDRVYISRFRLVPHRDLVALAAEKELSVGGAP